MEDFCFGQRQFMSVLVGALGEINRFLLRSQTDHKAKAITRRRKEYLLRNVLNPRLLDQIVPCLFQAPSPHAKLVEH